MRVLLRLEYVGRSGGRRLRELIDRIDQVFHLLLGVVLMLINLQLLLKLLRRRLLRVLLLV